MPMPQSVFAAQSPRLLLPCLAFTQGPRHLAQQNHLSRSYRPVQRRPAKPPSLPYHPGFPADLAKLLTFNFQRSTDNGNLRNDISLLLPPASLPTAILLNHPVRHPPSTASPPPPSTTASATAPPSNGSSTSAASRPPPPQRHRQRPQPRRRPPLHRAPDRQGHHREPQNPGSSNTSPTWPSNSLTLSSKAHDLSRLRKLCPSTKSDKT